MGKTSESTAAVAQSTITLVAPFLIHAKVPFISLVNNHERKDKGHTDEAFLVNISFKSKEIIETLLITSTARAL